MRNSNQPSRHLNSYIHSIIQHIKRNPIPVSFSEIQNTLNINLFTNPMILSALKKNPKIIIYKDTIQFKPKYDIKAKEDIKNLLISTKNEYGIEVNELLDCPCDIKLFIQELLNDNEIFLLKDSDGSEIIFNNPVDVKQLDDTIKEMWNRIRIPDYEEVKRELQTAGLKSSRDEKKRKILVEPKKKPKRYKRKIKITNTHVKDLNLDF